MYFCALKRKNSMNYEELLASRSDGKQQKAQQPIGYYYREEIDSKWRGVVDVRKDMSANIVFSKALKAECEKNKELVNNRQIHFSSLSEESGDIQRLELEPGNFISYEQMLKDDPAVVARKRFFGKTLASLAEITDYLHQQGIKHVCFSPKTVFVRKGDSTPLVLSHGSFYLDINDQRGFYGDDAQFVAPEVLDHGTIDERCDVYSIGKFMQSLYDQSDVPFLYRSVIKKATSELPEDRYDSPQDMLKDIKNRKSMFISIRSLLIAVVVALLLIGLYFEYFPETQPVEFVKPAPRQPTDDLLDDGFDPAELGVTNDGDSLVVDETSLRDYEAKAEEIFRKKYEKEADRILSKIYNKSYMNNSEKKFMTESESTIEELMKAQSEIGSDAGLSPERAQLIATEIIDRVTNQKKKEMGGGGSTNSNGVKLPDKK